jgi:hypothetical protein
MLQTTSITASFMQGAEARSRGCCGGGSGDILFLRQGSQSMGLQSVIKIRGKTSKLFALHASPFQ